jgi:hypothetical protein
MRWVFENLQVIIAVAGAIAYWLVQRQRAKQGLPPTDEDGRVIPSAAAPTTVTDIDEAERTRRIQEEIRRKIAERRSGTPTTPREPPTVVPAPARTEATPPPVFPEPMQEMMRELQKRFAPEPSAPAPEPEIDREAVARQRDLDEKFQALEAAKRAAQKRAAIIAEAEVVASTPSMSDTWITDLRDPQNIRRAIILREILGPPVGLR